MLGFRLWTMLCHPRKRYQSLYTSNPFPYEEQEFPPCAVPQYWSLALEIILSQPTQNRLRQKLVSRSGNFWCNKFQSMWKWIWNLIVDKNWAKMEARKSLYHWWWFLWELEEIVNMVFSGHIQSTGIPNTTNLDTKSHFEKWRTKY